MSSSLRFAAALIISHFKWLFYDENAKLIANLKHGNSVPCFDSAALRRLTASGRRAEQYVWHIQHCKAGEDAKTYKAVQAGLSRGPQEIFQ